MESDAENLLYFSQNANNNSHIFEETDYDEYEDEEEEETIDEKMDSNTQNFEFPAENCAKVIGDFDEKLTEIKEKSNENDEKPMDIVKNQMEIEEIKKNIKQEPEERSHLWNTRTVDIRTLFNPTETSTSSTSTSSSEPLYIQPPTPPPPEQPLPVNNRCSLCATFVARPALKTIQKSEEKLLIMTAWLLLKHECSLNEARMFIHKTKYKLVCRCHFTELLESIFKAVATSDYSLSTCQSAPHTVIFDLLVELNSCRMISILRNDMIEGRFRVFHVISKVEIDNDKVMDAAFWASMSKSDGTWRSIKRKFLSDNYEDLSESMNRILSKKSGSDASVEDSRMFIKTEHDELQMTSDMRPAVNSQAIRIFRSIRSLFLCLLRHPVLVMLIFSGLLFGNCTAQTTDPIESSLKSPPPQSETRWNPIVLAFYCTVLFALECIFLVQLVASVRECHIRKYNFFAWRRGCFPYNTPHSLRILFANTVALLVAVGGPYFIWSTHDLTLEIALLPCFALLNYSTRKMIRDSSKNWNPRTRVVDGLELWELHGNV